MCLAQDFNFAPAISRSMPVQHRGLCGCQLGWLQVSRRSTTSYMLKLNGCLIVSSCKLQTTIALSSAESELYAAASCIAEMIQVGALVKFLVKDTQDYGQKDQKVQLKLYSDSSSARSIAQRMGQGRLKHIDLRYLWIQEMVKRKVVSVNRVGTIYNVSDLNTKKLSLARRKFLMNLIPMARGDDGGFFEIIRDEEEVDKKRVMRVVRSLLEVTCATSLQGCYATAGCENVWSLYGIIGCLLLVVIVLCAVIRRYIVIVEKFKVASREVRRMLHRNHGAEGEEEREVDPLVAEATLGWFGEREWTQWTSPSCPWDWWHS